MNVMSRVFLRDFYRFLKAYDFFRLTPNGLLRLGPYSSRNEIFPLEYSGRSGRLLSVGKPGSLCGSTSYQPSSSERGYLERSLKRLMTKPPVLFLLFNRPDTTELVFEAIRQAQPARLYVSADGPRPNHKAEAERCDQARRITTKVDWPCEVKTLFRDQNLGCKSAVSSAITWFFENEEEGIVLEDDCLPAPDFFPFCEELLTRYREDRRIMAICGSNYAPKAAKSKGSYYFSYFADVWGWATWRRAWSLYDQDLTRWAKFKRNGGSAPLSGMARWRFQYWERYFDLTADGKIDTWDYQWIFTVIESGGLACYPRRNLISNLGFRPDATHTKPKDGPGGTAYRLVFLWIR